MSDENWLVLSTSYAQHGFSMKSVPLVLTGNRFSQFKQDYEIAQLFYSKIEGRNK